MRALRCCLAVVLVFGSMGVARAHGQDVADGQAMIKAMAQGVTDWNKGDLAAFETTYKNSPDIVFMGGTVRRGYDGMVQTYERNYATPEKRGVLSYTGLEVHALDARFAFMIGRYHLERTAAGGGNADGEFSLIWEKTAAGWKIVLDHTGNSAPPKTPAASNP